MAPVIKSLINYSEEVESVVCVIAQHREMLDQVLKTFEIVPNHDLNLMNPDQSLALLTANILTALDKVITLEKPESYSQMANAINRYGDGQAGQRIEQFLLGQPVEGFG